MTPREAWQLCARIANERGDETATAVHGELIKLAHNLTTASDDKCTRRARFCAILQGRSSETRALQELPSIDSDPLRITWGGELAGALRIAESVFAVELDRIRSLRASARGGETATQVCTIADRRRRAGVV